MKSRIPDIQLAERWFSNDEKLYGLAGFNDFEDYMNNNDPVYRALCFYCRASGITETDRLKMLVWTLSKQNEELKTQLYEQYLKNGT